MDISARLGPVLKKGLAHVSEFKILMETDLPMDHAPLCLGLNVVGDISVALAKPDGYLGEHTLCMQPVSRQIVLMKDGGGSLDLTILNNYGEQ